MDLRHTWPYALYAWPEPTHAHQIINALEGSALCALLNDRLRAHAADAWQGLEIGNASAVQRYGESEEAAQRAGQLCARTRRCIPGLAQDTAISTAHDLELEWSPQGQERCGHAQREQGPNQHACRRR